jgi:hypothetical protein
MNASDQINKRISETKDWRGKQLARLRQLIHAADPDIAEEWKWDSPVFTHGGMVCSIGAFKDHEKVNVFKGASIADPDGLFNAGLEAKTTRAIDLHEGEKLDEKAFKKLVAAAVAHNLKKK